MKKERAADDTRGELPWCEHEPRQRQVAVRGALTVTVDSTVRRKPPGSNMAVLYVILALVPVLVSLLLQPLHSPHPFLLESNATHHSPPRILLLTAHPDDETFFFGPTLTSLIPSLSAPVSESVREKASNTPFTLPQVYSLCFSVGNADGLGDIRRRELGDSLDVLGVTEDRRWVLDKSYVCLSYHVMPDTGN